jgi:energy-coupling factor transporter ATP-binding protein EcfA2
VARSLTSPATPPLPRRLLNHKACRRYFPPRRSFPGAGAWAGFLMQYDLHSDDDGGVRLGTREHWGGESPVTIADADRRQHVYVVGQSGTGKSTALLNVMTQLVRRGQSVFLIDPHGDLSLQLLDRIPSHRADDLVWFDPADRDHAPAYNWLACPDPSRRHLVVSGIVAAMKGVWGDSFGPRMEHILNAALLALSECENASLLGVTRLLVDERYRDWVLGQTTDVFVQQFWRGEFASWDRRFQNEATAPVLNKVGAVLLSPPLRAVFGQVNSKIDFRHLMDTGRVFIARLSKGLLGEDKSSLAGSMLVSAINAAAQSRADVPEGERRPFSVVIDEFQCFSSREMPALLSEIRKTGGSLILAHQHLGQLPPAIAAAVFGNVGTMVALRVGEQDAQTLARHYGGDLAPGQLVDLPNHCAVVKQLVAGEQRDPVRCRLHAPTPGDPRRQDKLLTLSRARHATPRAVVEDKLARWMAN